MPSERVAPPGPARNSRLRQLTTMRRRWLAELTRRLDRDPRVQGAWLIGSLGRGQADVWSDLDIVVAVDQRGTSVHPATWIKQIPWCPVLFGLDVPRNAPAGGVYRGLCVQLAGLPVWSDWYLWPVTTVSVPVDAAVLVERPAEPLRRSAESFMELLDQHRTSATGKANRADPRFRLLAVMLAAKYLARGDTDRLDHMLRLLGPRTIRGEPPEALLAAALYELDAAVLRPAVQAVSRLVDLAIQNRQTGR